MKENISFLNCFLLNPSFLFRHEQHTRLPKILPFIKENGNPSIIGLSEVFRGFSPLMISKANEMKYNCIYYNDGYIQNSGLMFLYCPKKWKLMTHKKETFKNYIGSDKFANKGFIIAKMLHKESRKYVFFVLTHLNANQKKSKKTAKVQFKQLQQIKNFIDKHISNNQLIVFFGDFNIDYDDCENILKEEIHSLGNLGNPLETTTNEWSKEGPQILDYIILKNIEGSPKTYVTTYNQIYLSDHNLITRTIHLQK